MRLEIPAGPADEDAEKRWAAIAVLMAEQTRECVTLLECIGGHCREIARECPTDEEPIQEES